MSELDQNDKTATIAQATQIVSSFVSNNPIQSQDLPGLIHSVHAAIEEISQPQKVQQAQKPAVPVKKSITDEYLICLEDGKPYKSLKRHLKAKYNMTPEEYRAKWGLAPDYPMVAPSYSERRSALAKKAKLGHK